MCIGVPMRIESGDGMTAVAFSEVGEAFLREGSYDEVSRWLRAIPGVGA